MTQITAIINPSTANTTHHFLQEESGNTSNTSEGKRHLNGRASIARVLGWGWGRAGRLRRSTSASGVAGSRGSRAAGVGRNDARRLGRNDNGDGGGADAGSLGRRSGLVGGWLSRGDGVARSGLGGWLSRGDGVAGSGLVGGWLSRLGRGGNSSAGGGGGGGATEVDRDTLGLAETGKGDDAVGLLLGGALAGARQGGVIKGFGLFARALQVGERASNSSDAGDDALLDACWDVGKALGGSNGGDSSENDGVLHFEGWLLFFLKKNVVVLLKECKSRIDCKMDRG